MSENIADPPDNGAVHTVANSAAEAELGGLFINAKTAVPIRKHWRSLGTSSPQHRFKRIIQQPVEL